MLLSLAPEYLLCKRFQKWKVVINLARWLFEGGPFLTEFIVQSDFPQSAEIPQVLGPEVLLGDLEGFDYHADLAIQLREHSLEKSQPHVPSLVLVDICSVPQALHRVAVDSSEQSLQIAKLLSSLPELVYLRHVNNKVLDSFLPLGQLGKSIIVGRMREGKREAKPLSEKARSRGGRGMVK